MDIQTCSVVGVDYAELFYRVCPTCEKTLVEESIIGCGFCANGKGFKRLFRILMSIANDTKVFMVIMFDKAARNLIGCSADEYFDFAKNRPYAGMAVGRMLEGVTLRVTLAKPKNGTGQHLRVVTAVPLQTGFQPVIRTLREVCQLNASNESWLTLKKDIEVVTQAHIDRMKEAESVAKQEAGQGSSQGFVECDDDDDKFWDDPAVYEKLDDAIELYLNNLKARPFILGPSPQVDREKLD